jgi:hypothetical protein
MSPADAVVRKISYIHDTRFQAPVFSGIADGGGYNTGSRPLHAYGRWPDRHDKSNLVNSLRFGFHWVGTSPTLRLWPKISASRAASAGVPNDPLVNGLTWFNGRVRRIGRTAVYADSQPSQDIQLNDTLSLYTASI